MQELAVSPMTSTVHWGESVFHLSTLQAVGDILVTHSESRQSSNSEIWEELRPRLDLLALITLWRTLEPGDIESSLNDAFIRSVFGEWGSDRFARGSYSHAGPDSQSDDYKALAEPIGNLFFAGEHTSSMHPATVHGAYMSGIRAASKVLGFMIGSIDVHEARVSSEGSLQRSTH
jgi:hypothetical protein